MNNLNQIKKLWEEGLGQTEISKLLGLSTGYVSVAVRKIYGDKYVKRFIYKRRVYTLNESFFDEIDKEQKAYFLGLLAADGNLTKDQNSVRIGLNEKDKEILETFREHLNYTKPLKLIIKSKTDWNRSNQYLLEVSSSVFRKGLEKQGLTPNKSFTLRMPLLVPTNLIHHYIRGYFDGDGCIHIDKRNHAGISIAGGEQFCIELSNLLTMFGIKSSIFKHCRANCYYVRSFGRTNILTFYEFLYKDSTIYMDRKKEKFETWINKSRKI